MLGYDEDEFSNDPKIWEKILSKDDLTRSKEMISDLILGKIDRLKIEIGMKHKNDHWVDILSRANAFFNENGETVRIVGTQVDLTEIKNIERKNREVVELLRTIFKNSIVAWPFLILTIDIY